MNGTGAAKIPFHFDSIKVRVRVGGESAIKREMDAEAITSLLWLALKTADESGFEALVDDIGQLHLRAVRLRHRIVAEAEAA